MASSRQWHVIDAEDVVLGKLASKAAMMLMGKHKPIYTPFLDTGDHVIVINADKVRLTGRKEERQSLSPLHRLSRRTGGEEHSSGCARNDPSRMVEEAIRACFRRPSSASRCTGS